MLRLYPVHTARLNNPALRPSSPFQLQGRVKLTPRLSGAGQLERQNTTLGMPRLAASPSTESHENRLHNKVSVSERAVQNHKGIVLLKC